MRPSLQECQDNDLQILHLEYDDLTILKERCLTVRAVLNKNLPPHELALDNDLAVRASTIPNAGDGLFYKPHCKPHNVIHAGSTICFYTGHRHNFLSQKYLQDKSYLLCVSGDILVDPGPVITIKARYINDPLNDQFVNCKFVPQSEQFRCAVVATRDIIPGEELFVSYGEMYWSQQKYVGTVLKR